MASAYVDMVSLLFIRTAEAASSTRRQS